MANCRLCFPLMCVQTPRETRDADRQGQDRMTGADAAARGPAQTGDRSGSRHRQTDAGLLVRRAARPAPHHHSNRVQRWGADAPASMAGRRIARARSACPNPQCAGHRHASAHFSAHRNLPTPGSRGSRPRRNGMKGARRDRNGEQTLADVTVLSLGARPDGTGPGSIPGSRAPTWCNAEPDAQQV